MYAPPGVRPSGTSTTVAESALRYSSIPMNPQWSAGIKTPLNGCLMRSR